MSRLDGLGRRRAPDPNDLKYPLPRKRREAVGVVRRHWYSPGILDQGNTSQCVAYAGTKWQTSGPVTNKPIMTPAALYKECQRNDEWPGEEPRYYGTSVRALFKVLKARGLISEYRWALDVQSVADHVAAIGPVVMGTEWPDQMFMPDRWNYISPESRRAYDQGHAWLITGVDYEKVHPLTKQVGAVRCANSWGTNWGDKGRFWLTFADLNFLIQADGEAAAGIETKASS